MAEAKLNYKVKEHPDHYEVDDGKGPFKIAKHAIPGELHAHIRKMAKGGVASEDVASTSEEMDVPGGISGVASLAKRALQTPEDIEAERQEAAQVPATTGATGSFEAPTQVAPQPPVHPAVKAGGPSGGEGGAAKEYEKAEKGQEAAALAQAALATKQGAAQAVLQHQSLEAQDAFNKSEDAKEAAHQTELAQSIRDFKEGKINPNQLWEQSDFGSKASALIGIVLGGIGAAYTGGPNQALGVIQKQIDRNIDAQVKNKQNQESMINTLMRQGYDMRQARGVAEARMKDRLAGQMEAAASDFLGEKAQAAAQTTIAALRADSVQIKQKMRAEGLDSTLKSLQIQSTRFGIQNQEFQRVATAQLLSGKPVDPYLMSYLSSEMQKRFGPNAEEVGAHEALGAAAAADIHPLLAKIPFTASKAEREAHAGNVAARYLKMQGQDPSKRNPMWEVLHNAGLDLSSPIQEKKNKATAFFMDLERQNKQKRALGYGSTPSPSQQPVESES